MDSYSRRVSLRRRVVPCREKPVWRGHSLRLRSGQAPPANSPPKRSIRGYRKFGYVRIGRMIHRANGAPCQRRKQQRDYAYAIRTVRSDRDVGHLCIGEPQFLVHPGVRRRLPARLCVWFSARRVALRSGRGHLVGSSPAPLVSRPAVMSRIPPP